MHHHTTSTAVLSIQIVTFMNNFDIYIEQRRNLIVVKSHYPPVYMIQYNDILILA